jgi:glutamine synthetase
MKDYILTPDQLEAEGIRTVIIASPDLNGRLIGRRVPVGRFASVVKNGVDISTCVYGWDFEQGLELIEANVFPITGMHNSVKDVTLKVDLGTLRRAAWLDHVAVCFADPEDPQTGEPLTLSPRVMLKQELARYEKLGIQPMAGTELEFYLFKNDPRELRASGFRDLDPTTQYSADFHIQEGNSYEPFFQKLRDDLEASGIEMEAAQSEWGTGQWEMTFAYGEPLEMADRHSLYKMAVRDAAAKAGMSATFMAMPYTEQAGSSCHIHVSMLSQGEDAPVFWDEQTDDNMSELMRHAVAGTLEHTAEFMGWYWPTINSWRRGLADDLSGSGHTWGYDNRFASVRVLGHQPEQLRFEFRVPGADTVPYLALAGVLASARDGIERKLPLVAPTHGVVETSEDDRGQALNLSEAATALEKSEFVRDTFGAVNAEHMATLLHHEWSVFMKQVSDFDLRRYFDRV